MDLRSSSRIAVHREFVSIDAFRDEYVMDVSRQGVFVRTSSPLPIGTLVNLRFSILLDDIETIEGLGKVVRTVVAPSDRRGMGVVFIRLDSVSDRIIEGLFTAPAPAQDD